MKNIYFDNASTTIYKPKPVIDGVYNFLINNGTSSNRGSNSFTTDKIIWDTRVKISTFFNCNKPENIVFTKNITDSANIIIRGIFDKNDHVITSNLEHNAIIRTLIGNDINYSIADYSGENYTQILESRLNPNTKAVIITHASNVSGDILPIDEISKFCKKNNLFFILDTAQTAGILPISSKNIDIIMFTGHKSLYGIQGIGGFVINDSNILRPTSFGGTGSSSSGYDLPNSMPEKFEVGTLNIPGIISLYHSFDFLSFDFFAKELELLNHFNNCLLSINNIETVGLTNKKVAISSINFKNCDNSEATDFLNSNGITTRSGLHCSPLAHKTLNTFDTGTVRFSFDYNNTIEEIDFSLNIIEKLSKF